MILVAKYSYAPWVQNQVSQSRSWFATGSQDRMSHVHFELSARAEVPVHPQHRRTRR